MISDLNEQSMGTISPQHPGGEPMIYRHLFVFRTTDQALRAENTITRLVQALRCKACEHNNVPVVVFETEHQLDECACIRLARLAIVRATFNSPCLSITEHLEDTPLTPEQERLYQHLKSYCAENSMWVGDAAQLAHFADLRYPFDPDIVYGLVERGLIKHNVMSSYCLTINLKEGD
jgi:hypothetical protein